MVNKILQTAQAENKRARTMDIDDFIRYVRIIIYLKFCCMKYNICFFLASYMHSTLKEFILHE